jgi:hypothetical protein
MTTHLIATASPLMGTTASLSNSSTRVEVEIGGKPGGYGAHIA